MLCCKVQPGGKLRDRAPQWPILLAKPTPAVIPVDTELRKAFCRSVSKAQDGLRQLTFVEGGNYYEALPYVARRNGHVSSAK